MLSENNITTGIITFHNSYNCGSMLETYAMQEVVRRYCTKDVEIINFSNEGQIELYSKWFKPNSLKNIIKNILLLPNIKKIEFNNKKYEEFKNKYFNLSDYYATMEELTDKNYGVVVSGSDQIWNITIEDGDDAYFLPWVTKAKKIAYAPSFGSKKISKYTSDIQKYIRYLNSYDALSVREKNGQKWIEEMIGIKVPQLVDPTLILSRCDYSKLIATDIEVREKYIFFYSPGHQEEILNYVYQISNKYKLKVITWSAKSYSTKLVRRFGFELPSYESPSSYLYYIKNAELVLTTSYHGTIFSTIFNKKFFTIKNGGMLGDDDRVKTLLEEINMCENLIFHKYDEKFDYLMDVNYKGYHERVNVLRKNAVSFLTKNYERFK